MPINDFSFFLFLFFLISFRFPGEDNVVAGGGGGDPAVLAVGPARKPLQYTRDQLMRLRNSPLVKRNLENAFAGCEALAL